MYAYSTPYICAREWEDISPLGLQSTFRTDLQRFESVEMRKRVSEDAQE